MRHADDAQYLLISDVDGTLTGDNSALQALAEWLEPLRPALRLVYASGRFAHVVLETVLSSPLPAPDALIGGVGSEIRDFPSLTSIEGWEFHIGEGWEPQRVRDLLEGEAGLELQEPRFQSEYKVSYYVREADPDRLERLANRLSRAGVRADFVYSSGRDLDVLPSGVNKGSAARYLVDRWRFPADRVIVAGNSANDAALYEKGFLGIVVANARELEAYVGDRVYGARQPFAGGLREGLEHWLDIEEVRANAEDLRKKRQSVSAEGTCELGPEARGIEGLCAQGYARSLDLLRRCCTESGFLATTSDLANYRRVWGRDGSLMALAALASGEGDLLEGARRTLLTLADYQGPHGQIPSNVDPVSRRVSYGGTAGRVDASLWFIIAAGQLLRVTHDRGFLDRIYPFVERARFLLGAWEFNARGLLYVPATGDWADEYLQSGYVLYDQLLYLQSLRECAAMHREIHAGADHALEQSIDRLEHLIMANYWFHESEEDDQPRDVYHEVLYRKGQEAAERRRARYWMAFFGPGGYGFRFDTMANVLASLLGVATEAQREEVDEYIQKEVVDREVMLLPAFWPVIYPRDKAWEELQVTFSYEFKNHPNEYHNGGLWPMVTSFYVADLAHRGRQELARRYLAGVHLANARPRDGQPWSFSEFLHGEHHAPGGMHPLGWNAALVVLATKALDGRPMFVEDRIS